jgi:hypothetical protein
VLAQPSKFVRKTLVTLGLDAVFPVYETVADGILHFKKGVKIGKLDLAGGEVDEALHGAVPILFRKVVEAGEFPPNQVGRIVNLHADGLVFRYGPAAPEDPVVGTLVVGTRLKLKFRQPFAIKDYYFEMDADIVEVTETKEAKGKVLTVKVQYFRIGDDARKHLDQFVRDQEIWRSEVRS